MLESFIAILLSHEKSLDRAAKRGNEGRGESGPVDRDERRTRSPTPDSDQHLRKHGPSPDAEPATANQLAGASNKKRRIYKVDQPWYLRDFIAQSVLSPSLTQTRKILVNFSADFPAIKRWINASASVPGFPDSEWDSIIQGKSVNLDAVLSGMYTISNVVENTEELGSLQVRFGYVEPAKTVKTHGEWIIAWYAASDATLFCFPH